MVAIKGDLWLDDGDQAGGLADGSVAGQAVGSLVHRLGAGARWDGDNRAPLGETGALRRVGYIWIRVGWWDGGRLLWLRSRISSE